jgi:hypothetical protein
VVEGRAALKDDRDLLIRVLAALTRKYAPQHESPAFEERVLPVTFIIEMVVDRWSGKYHL